MLIKIYKFLKDVGKDKGETPLFSIIIILIQSTNLHASPVWTGA